MLSAPYRGSPPRGRRQSAWPVISLRWWFISGCFLPHLGFRENPYMLPFADHRQQRGTVQLINQNRDRELRLSGRPRSPRKSRYATPRTNQYHFIRARPDSILHFSRLPRREGIFVTSMFVLQGRRFVPSSATEPPISPRFLNTTLNNTETPGVTSPLRIPDCVTDPMKAMHSSW